MKQSRRGFTLIELLVVIGIILILMGLLVAGYRHIGAASAKKQTIAQLHVLRGMLTEFENHAGMLNASNESVMFSGVFSGYTTNPLVAPAGDLGPAGSLRYTNAIVTNTQTAMRDILKVPANRNIFQSEPPNRILEPLGTSSAVNIDYGGVLLDGWSNPIILVPPSGLQVNIVNQANPTGAAVTYIVRTSGMYQTGSGSTVPPVTANDHPFFASAGADGDFSIGEDNVYSFQD